MRADNEGEGGIMALIALIRRVVLKRHKAKVILVGLGICGASLFYGDGMITPAISVISAVEGLKVVSPELSKLIVPLTLIILVALFSAQRKGTAAVGRFFGPIIGFWFVVLAIGGIHQIVIHPEILTALSPSYGFEFLLNNFSIAFIALASVVLVVTGAEALYADMGHFGRPAISRAWFFCAFPALTLNYLGQGALILNSPKAINGTLFLMYPHWAQLPLVFLATAATVIASQALISGAFSISRQAVQLGFLPRLRIQHTSEKEEGQIYVPTVNWSLLAGVALIVVGFGSSAALASAYGVAVTGTFITTTILFLVVARSLWRKPLWMVIPLGAILLTVDLAFFTANLSKIAHGGWLPLLIAAVVFTLLMTWQRGRKIVTKNRTKKEGPLLGFVEKFNTMTPPVHRVPGTAVFLHANPETTPMALRANVEHNHSLHENVIIMAIQVMPFPHLDHAEWLMIDDLGHKDDGIAHITARIGYNDKVDVPQLVRTASTQGLECEVCEDCSYFLSHISLAKAPAKNMARWRKNLFIAMSRQATNPVDFFGLAAERTVVMGGRIDV